MIVYGIKNCDSVKKTTTWLTANNVSFEFHDYKTKGISKEKLQEWVNQVGFEILVNKKGTTWKQLDETVKASVIDGSSAIMVMSEKTSVIKRPVIEADGKVIIVGYDEKTLEKILRN
jgi:arsenate reductase (glutaredoxin)